MNQKELEVEVLKIRLHLHKQSKPKPYISIWDLVGLLLLFVSASGLLYIVSMHTGVDVSFSIYQLSQVMEICVYLYLAFAILTLPIWIIELRRWKREKQELEFRIKGGNDGIR